MDLEKNLQISINEARRYVSGREMHNLPIQIFLIKECHTLSVHKVIAFW